MCLKNYNVLGCMLPKKVKDVVMSKSHSKAFKTNFKEALSLLF